MSKTSSSTDRNGSRPAKKTSAERHENADGEKVLPSDVSEHVGLFDRFAQWTAELASRAVFFAFCVLLIVLWVPTIFFMKFDISQLLINTSTTIITFLLVALLENSQSRADKAVQHKLNAIADALADHIESSPNGKRHKRDADELRRAVGLEFVESSDE